MTREQRPGRWGALLLLSVAVMAAIWVAHPEAAGATQFDLSLTTSRGCLETGDNPVFAVGETLKLTFRIGSGSAASAATALFDVLADGRVGVISFGQLPTNQNFVFSARVGPPTGVEKLVLQADALGVQRTRKACSFTVVPAGTPAATNSPTPTRTPLPTTTAATVTPGAPLEARVRTDRGCLETGDDATYAIGDRIRIFYSLNSPTLTKAKASLADIMPDGSVKIFDFGVIPTDVTFVLTGSVGPPGGVKTLRLRGQAIGVPTAIADCSFRAAGNAPPTRTATPRPPTRTRTATRTPAPCTGACTNPGIVTLNDVVKVAQIAAGDLPLSACPAADRDGNGIVTLAEVMVAVNNAINGC